MNIPHEEIFDLLQQLAEHKNIRVCVKQSALIGTITGLSALFGGLMGGRNGAIAGAAVATVACGFLADDYVSVIHVIKNEMNDAQRRRLLQSAKNILIQISGPVTLRAILNNEKVSSSLSSLIKSSVKDLGYSI